MQDSTSAMSAVGSKRATAFLYRCCSVPRCLFADRRIFLQHCFNLFPLLIQNAASHMVIVEEVTLPQSLKQAGMDGIPEGGIPYVDVRIGRKGAGLRTAVGIDVEETASGSHTAAVSPLITGESQQDHVGINLPQPVHRLIQEFPLRISRGKVLSIFGHRDEFDEEYKFTAPFGQDPDKFRGCDFADIFRGHCHGCPEQQIPFVKGIILVISLS